MAIKAKNRGDFEQSEIHYRKAVHTALSMPSHALDPDPLLKLSGISVALSALLESSNQPSEAYEALRDALDLFGPDPLAADAVARSSGSWAGGSRLSEADHIRAIGLSQKLGQLALQNATASIIRSYPAPARSEAPKTWDKAAEYHLSAALTAMLRLGLATRPTGSKGAVVVGRDVDLSDSSSMDEGGRVDRRGLGMTMESLAEVYARKGQYDLAGQLLLQAVSTLLPPQAIETPPVADRCQGEPSPVRTLTLSVHPADPRSAALVGNARWTRGAADARQ